MENVLSSLMRISSFYPQASVAHESVELNDQGLALCVERLSALDASLSIERRDSGCVLFRVLVLLSV